MKQVTGPQLARAIEKRGWVLARVRGSHHIYTKPGRRERIVIPIHGNRPLKVGLAKAQMRIAGIDETEV